MWFSCLESRGGKDLLALAQLSGVSFTCAYLYTEIFLSFQNVWIKVVILQIFNQADSCV